MLHIIFLLLCSSTSLFAGQIAAPALIQTAPEHIFSKLNVRPMGVDRIYELCAHGREADVQQFLPPYTELVTMIAGHAPLEQIIDTLQDETTFATLYKEQPQENRLALNFQHNMHALIACAYLQHNNLYKAYIAAANAFATTANADWIDPYGCSVHNPLAALVAEYLLQRMDPMYRESSDLAVVGGHIAAAHAHMNKKIALEGSWTDYDTQLLQWYTATICGKTSPLFNLNTCAQLLAKIQHTSPELYGLFLATQLEAGMQATPIDNEYIRTIARIYSEHLLAQNPCDPEDDALRLLCIAAKYDDCQIAFRVGTIFLQRACHAVTRDNKKIASLQACSFFKQASQIKEDRKLADKATFNALKIAHPYQDDETANLKQVTNQLAGFLKQKGERHFLAPLVHAYLATHYGKLAKNETTMSLKKRYQQLKKTSTSLVKKSGNNVAMNYVDYQELISRPIDDQITNPIDTILARSTSYIGTVKPDLDTLLATFDHTIGFEYIQQAAHMWGLRAQVALKQTPPNGADHVKCLLKAYALDPNYPYTLSVARNYINEHVRAGDIPRAQMFLDELETLQKNVRTLFWRGNLEQTKGNHIAALALFECSGLPRALHNAGAIYHGGGNGIEKNLTRAREYYERAEKLQPEEALHIRALADIAAEENRHNDHYTLLQKLAGMQGCTALDVYNLVKLSISGLINQATVTGTYKHCIAIAALATHETGCTLSPEQLAECADLSTCLALQIRKAQAQDMAQLMALGQKGILEAYHALVHQQYLIEQATTDQTIKQNAIKMEKLYLQKALDIAPQCNRTLLRLAELTMPTICPIDSMSIADICDLDDAYQLYKRVLAAPSNDAYAAQAHMHHALILSQAYQKHEQALAHFYQAARLGSSRAYLALLDSSIKNRIYNALNDLLATDIIYDDFKTPAEKAEFDRRVAEAKVALQAHNSPAEDEIPASDDALVSSCAASSSV